MHDAARREVGPIVNDELRESRAVRLKKLPQGLNAIKEAGQIMPGNDDAFTRNGQPIALGA